MTPEQIKKHEPMNINNLYEAVPVERELPGEDGKYTVLVISEPNTAPYPYSMTYINGHFISVLDNPPIVVSWYRPVPRESIEVFLREFGDELHEQWLNSELPYEDCLTELITQTLGQ